MRQVQHIPPILLFYLLIVFPGWLHADLNNNQIINHQLAERINDLKEGKGTATEDFNACQITWSVKKLKSTDPYSAFQPHAITFRYENNVIIELVNRQDGSVESIQELGLNCLEFNNYVYLFFDTSDYGTRLKYDLTDLAYVTFSSDNGMTWSALKSLEPHSLKAKFILPFGRFQDFVKIFGNPHDHAISIFNLRDETTYLFSPTFELRKTVPVYNRLTNYNRPTDFLYHRNDLYLIHGSCEKIRDRFRCPPITYLETSRDFGRTWEKETLPFLKKSYMMTLNNTLYHFYFQSCPSAWFNFVPGLNRSLVCGHIKVRTLNILGHWEKPRTLIKTAGLLLDVLRSDKPILVWKDLRFHKSRACGFIPIVGCVDAEPFKGPNVVYAGELDLTTMKINESIIDYEI